MIGPNRAARPRFRSRRSSGTRQRCACVAEMGLVQWRGLRRRQRLALLLHRAAPGTIVERFRSRVQPLVCRSARRALELEAEKYEMHEAISCRQSLGYN